MSTGAPFALSDAELASRASALAPGLLAGRCVIVSGGGSGIGRATAWLAARLGARVVICGRNPEKLERVRAALSERGFPCDALTLDIRERAAVEAFFDRVPVGEAGGDLLVNCAGGQFPQAALDFTEKGWRAVIDTSGWVRRWLGPGATSE